MMPTGWDGRFKVSAAPDLMIERLSALAQKSL